MTGTTEADLEIRDLCHSYKTNQVLRDVSLEVPSGEFLTLLGPSGCGKTTMLRIIAGLLEPASGQVTLGGRNLLSMPVHRRPVNTVFQRPTLFPHLDVFSNAAFGLKLRSVSRSEIQTRVKSALEMVQLSGFETRRAGELSGGQVQRIALARAIVLNPKVLLLDEPLSALDLKIRLEMEVALRRVHRETGATFIYVTHDQREALALSDRIVIMNKGRVEQVGTSDQLYKKPASAFAASFVGNANVLPVIVESGNDGGDRLRLGQDTLDIAGSEPAWLIVRPEAVRLARPGDDGALAGTVQDVAFRGTGFGYRLDIEGLSSELRAEIPTSAVRESFEVGSKLSVAWDPSDFQLLPRED